MFTEGPEGFTEVCDTQSYTGSFTASTVTSADWASWNGFYTCWKCGCIIIEGTTHICCAPLHVYPVSNPSLPLAWPTYYVSLSQPYKCPVCQGSGYVGYPPGTDLSLPGFTASQPGPWKCAPCNGSGVLWGPPVTEDANAPGKT